MDRESIAEWFSAFGPVSIRRMFSGFGIYADDICFALFLRGELFLKADDDTAKRFAVEASSPFSYTQTKSGKTVVVNSFWRLPERLYDDADELAEWARQALDVARRLRLANASKPRSVKSRRQRTRTKSEKKAARPSLRARARGPARPKTHAT